MRARVRIASVALLFIVLSRIASASFHVKRSRQRALAIQRRGDDGSIARNIAYRYRTRENVSSLQLASLRRRHGRLSYIYIHRHRRLTGRSRTPRMTYPRARFRVRLTCYRHLMKDCALIVFLQHRPLPAVARRFPPRRQSRTMTD